MMTPTPAYRADIDGLRAVAVLSVIAYHAFPQWVTGGFVGVDVFFVISGYLISGIIFNSLQSGEFNFRKFYARRIKRIFPALILVLLATYITGWFVLLAEDYKQLAKHVFSAAGFVANFALWKEGGYFDIAAELKPLMHLWSLGVEEQFYLLWPALLYVAWRRKINFLSLILIIAVLSFSFNVAEVHSDVVAAFYLPITRFWELLVGSILAYTHLFRPNATANIGGRLELTLRPAVLAFLREVKPWIGLLLILTALVCLNQKSAFPGWWALLPTVGTALVISADRHAWLNRQFLAHPIPVFFGIISYPLYLWHWPLLSFARIMEFKVGTIEVGVVTVFTSTLLAWLSYVLAERPIRFGQHSPMKIVVLCVLMIAVAGVGVLTFERNGIGSRIPYALQQFVNVDVKTLRTGWRYNRCMLEREFDKTAFARECIENQRPLLFLWGDSHAAALYPGLKYLQTTRTFGVSQFNSASCPPFLTFADETGLPHCKDINDFDIETIHKIKPTTVLLHANWREGQSTDGLPITVKELEKIGIAKIILVGPAPQWEEPLPKTVLAYYKQFVPHRLAPLRMKYRLVDEIAGIEQKMRAKAEELGIDYISLLEILCNRDGCLTRIGDDANELTTFDGAHLTTSASRFVALSIADRLFPPNTQPENSGSPVLHY